MHLLERKTDGQLVLREFLGENVPAYAILSHTWGDEEVSFRDVEADAGKNMAGWKKIDFCAKQAGADGLRYIWVDTCCIDKSSSAELQEAICSMFRWYQKAARCYVFLSDVLVGDKGEHEQSYLVWEAAFRKSRWFRRGWTLQELLAPSHVEFFSVEGILLGDKSSLKSQIHEITRIPIDALQGRSPLEYSIVERFKWAEHRRTKREEDKAYALLGLFDVSMPLLYGEGFSKAFHRLCLEVNRLSDHPYNGE